MTPLETAQRMAEEAKIADTGLCIYGEPVFYLENPEALVEGHIYSDEGIRE